MEKQITKKYSNGEVTVVWQPHLCSHSAICFKGLPTVFDPRKRPWVTPEGGTTEEIVAQVKKCPSGALSCQMEEQTEVVATVENNTVVEMLPNGPLLVYGNLTIKDTQGNQTKKSQITAFCRCGHSGNKPYCDGSHVKAKFEG
ncbi:MAG: (4Fe-4S)-binding protein [Spirosomataceae bacterium]